MYEDITDSLRGRRPRSAHTSFSKQRRRNMLSRFLILAVCLSVSCLLWSFLTPTTERTASRRSPLHIRGARQLASAQFPIQTPAYQALHVAKQQEQGTPPESGKVMLNQDDHVRDVKVAPSVLAKDTPSSSQSQSSSTERPAHTQSPETNQRPLVNVAVPTKSTALSDNLLDDVLEMLPDEMRIRDLLRPLSGTGEVRLRDIGLRTRAFMVFFEAWEALHLVPSKNGDLFRDDVVQQLRQKTVDNSLAEKVRSYDAFRYFLASLSRLLFPWITPFYSDLMALHASFHDGGRGIVMTAGDNQASYLLTTITSMRNLGCDLPIEIMYLGDEDLGEDWRAELESLSGVITRDLSQMIDDQGWKLAGWAAKPFAIMMSSFREVILVDADALFFKDPATLFEDEQYSHTGALFFRDRLMMPESKKKWLQKVLPKPISNHVKQSRFWTGQSGHMQESGVLVVDKWRHFVPMLLVTRMNGPDRDGNEAEGKVGVYDMVYGDKETFWLAWELVGDVDYAFHTGSAGVMGKVKDKSTRNTEKPNDSEDNRDKDGEPRDEDQDQQSDRSIQEIDNASESSSAPNFTICAPQLLHLDTEGKPLWFNGWILNNKFADHKHADNSKFEAYLKEPSEISDPEAWQLAEDNRCCLTASEQYQFTDEETQTLDMIIDVAAKVAALDKRQ